MTKLLETKRGDYHSGSAPFSTPVPFSILDESSIPAASRPHFGGFKAARTYPAAELVYDTSTGAIFIASIHVSVAADFNHDGKPDIATYQGWESDLGSLHSRLFVILNRGDGSFSKPLPVEQFGSNGVWISQLGAADLNGDGYTDLIALDFAGQCFRVLINQGKGKDQGSVTFGSEIVIPIDTKSDARYNSLALGDIDGDGTQDFVTIGTGYVTHDTTLVCVRSFLGNGDGTFRTDSSYVLKTTEPIPVGQLPEDRNAALADMNGDGKLDLVVEIHGIGPPPKELLMMVVVFPGNGDGTFQPGLWDGAAVVRTDMIFSIDVNGVAALSIADLNRDSKPDVLLSYDQAEQKVFSALGNGDGTFAAPITAAADVLADPFVVADFDRDETVELLSRGAGDVRLYRSNGDGTFSYTGAKYAAGYRVRSGYFNVADFDGDGLLDFATTDGFELRVSIYLNSSRGFQAAEGITETDHPLEIFHPGAVLDLDGDGKQEVLFYQWREGINSLVAGFSDGAAKFRYVAALPGPIAPYQSVSKAADFNGDGRTDVLLWAENREGATVAISLSNGDGTLQTPIRVPRITSCVHDARALGEWAIGDVNGDGKADLVVATGGDDLCGGEIYGSGYFVLLGNGDGTFTTPAYHNVGSQPYRPVLVDVNGDRILDLVLADLPLAPQRSGAPFNIYLMLGNGDGTFGAPSVLISSNLVVDILHGDTNGDGNPDLVLLSTGFFDSFGLYYPSLAGAIELLGNGDGTFGSPTLFQCGFPAMSGALVDVNGDGALDLVSSLWIYPDTNAVQAGLSVALGSGDGSFSAPLNYSAGDLPWRILSGDFLADGSPDLVVATNYGGTIMVNQGGTTNTLTSSVNPAGAGQEITFTARIAAVISGRPLPTGNVEFFAGDSLLGTATISEGAASLVTSALEAGVHIITARYLGDDNFNVSTSNPLSIAVNALPPDIRLSSDRENLSLQRGSTGLITLSVAANASFDGSVRFQCSGLPAGASCLFGPSVAQLSANGTATVTLVITTTGTTVAAGQNSVVLAATGPQGRDGMPWAAGATLGISGSLLLLRHRRKLRRAAISLCVVAAILGSIAGMTACGDGKDTEVLQPAVSALTITATATSGETTITRTATVNLTIW
ncbi:MAG: FG-GAP-like repeat-containing protein [Terriglobales bacterium]